MITPILNKDPFLAEPPFQPLWTRAKTALSNCKKLIVIGYSFPPTDFHARHLLRQAFRSHPPQEVVIVNPDTTVVNEVLKLTHVEAAPSWHSTVEDYVSSAPLPAQTVAHPPRPPHIYSPGDLVTVATGHLEVGGLTLSGCLYRGVTIVNTNQDGTYQVQGIANINGVDEVTIPADWIQPYEPP